MPKIELVLAKGGTQPKDFSLHDSDHGFRVAEGMVELISTQTLPHLSALELGFLLLAAYLHDIGMCPEWGKVAAHRDYLVSGRAGGITNEEQRAFRNWISHREGATFHPPVSDWRYAEELLSHYCRARHTDWGAEWIQTNLYEYETTLYPGWLRHLTLICQSHHWGYSDLAGRQFDPLPLTDFGMLHRRYLAVILRVADILENDPERTPDVLLRHRSVTKASVPYWIKDHYIKQELLDKRQLIISACPTSALLHQAIEDHIDAIDEELRLCDRLRREHPFEREHVTGRLTLPHRWELESAVIRRVEPEPGTYEFIPGAFRPNTTKILELLSGLALYGEELVAVRELLQNAFDAVREQIARTSLSQFATDSRADRLLPNTHCVSLRLEVRQNTATLICRDSGVGMSKKLIKESLLVSGVSKPEDIIDLELRCAEAQITLERTGQFGIGVLSYFMLADHVVFRTRRSLQTGSSEAHGWEFETWGIGTLGELRPATFAGSGTEVRLSIKSSVLEKHRGRDSDNVYRDFYLALAKFISGLLVQVPCLVELTTTLPDCSELRWDPSWTTPVSAREDALINVIEDGLDPARSWLRGQASKESIDANERFQAILSPESAAEQLVKSHQIDKILSEVRSTLKWHGPFEGVLPNDVGVYRFYLPYFDLPSGRSLVYLRVEEAGERRRIETTARHGHLLPPHFEVRLAWKGMQVKIATEGNSTDYTQRQLMSRSLVALDINVKSPTIGTLHVDRRRFTLHRNQELERTLECLRRRIQSEQNSLIDSWGSSAYTWLNYRVASLKPLGTLKWMTDGLMPPECEWRTMSFPIIDQSIGANTSAKLYWRGKPITILPRLSNGDFYATDFPYFLDWHAATVLPDVVGFSPTVGLGLIPIWTRGAKVRPETDDGYRGAIFPPNWSTCCALQIQNTDYREGYGGRVMCWNKRHRLYKLLKASRGNDLAGLFRSGWRAIELDPIPMEQSILQSDVGMALWFELFLRRWQSNNQDEWKEVWLSLGRRSPNFCGALWRLCGDAPPGEAALSFYFRGEQSSDDHLIVLSRHNYRDITIKNLAENRGMLPDPGARWTVQQL